jgi:chromosomal replication initiator protein
MNPRAIIEVVCNDFGILPDDLREKKRIRKLVEPSQIIYYFIRQYTNLSLYGISQAVKRGTRNSVFNSIEKVENYKETDKNYKERINRLDEMIKLIKPENVQERNNGVLIDFYDRIIMAEFQMNDIY